VEKAGWSFAPSELRDLYIKELEDKRMKDHPSYKKLLDWKNTLLSSSPDQVKIDDGTTCMSDKYKAYVFIKRAGFRYENFCIDLKNAFDTGTDKFPDDIVEARDVLITGVHNTFQEERMKRKIRLYNFINKEMIKYRISITNRVKTMTMEDMIQKVSHVSNVIEPDTLLKSASLTRKKMEMI
jgi:hypothetical protein